MMMTLIAAAFAAQAPALRQGLAPLGFLVGHCWRGQFATGEVDTHCFESVFDGQHVRDRHEVTGGSRIYRGETLYSWDGSADRVTYTYWNTSGGVSRGTMRPEADRLQFGDEQYRGADGREISIATSWRRVDDDTYESTTLSPNSPGLNRTVRFDRVDPVTMSETRLVDGSMMLVHETLVEASVAQVWEAISTPEGWRGWAVPVAWTPEADILETSYNPAATPGDPSTIRHRLVASVPGRLMAFRTVKAPDGFPHFDTFARTTAMIELEPEGEGRTRVRTVSAGFPDDDAGRQLIGFFREGNRITLDRLRRRFSEGPIDWSRERDGAE
ncbi:MAG TPA: SRPBCC domain-containing protein [Allosphingosinicella sp.]|nr:SRPBCC domain-containing protein [Allosphingosinicella sp.]